MRAPVTVFEGVRFPLPDKLKLRIMNDAEFIKMVQAEVINRRKFYAKQFFDRCEALLEESKEDARTSCKPRDLIPADSVRER